MVINFSNKHKICFVFLNMGMISAGNKADVSHERSSLERVVVIKPSHGILTKIFIGGLTMVGVLALTGCCCCCCVTPCCFVGCAWNGVYGRDAEKEIKKYCGRGSIRAEKPTSSIVKKYR